MRLTNSQIEVIVEKIFAELKRQKVVVFKADEKQVFGRASEAIKENIEDEAQLDRDVVLKLDELERSNPGEFQRHKMFGLLKQKMAKERKMVL